MCSFLFLFLFLKKASISLRPTLIIPSQGPKKRMHLKSEPGTWLSSSRWGIQKLPEGIKRKAGESTAGTMEDPTEKTG